MIDFLIFTTPRSKSAWLANYLTYDNMVCYHEPCSDISSFDELDKLEDKNKVVGVVGSDLMVFAGQLINKYPKAKKLFIIRDLDEVAESLTRLGIYDVSVGVELANLVEKIKSISDIIILDFEELSDSGQCATLWKYLNQEKCVNRTRLDFLMNMNIQLHEINYDMSKMLTLIEEAA